MNARALAQIKTDLLQNPRRLDARQAAIRLLATRENLTPAVAKQRLDDVRENFALNDLFRVAMPREYAAELKKANGSRLQIGKKFFSALGFPVYEDVIMDQTAGETYYFTIPIVCLAFHACHDCFDFSKFPIHYQLGHLIGRPIDSHFGVDEEDRPKPEDKDWKHFAAKYKIPGPLQPRVRVDMEILFNLFEAEKNPLRFVPEVLRAMSYQTGSIFMDFDEEMGAPDIEWTSRNVDGLREEYQRALEVERNIKTLGQWLEEKPAPRIQRALRLYAQTRKLTDEHKRSPAANQGIALVRIL